MMFIGRVSCIFAINICIDVYIKHSLHNFKIYAEVDLGLCYEKLECMESKGSDHNEK